MAAAVLAAVVGRGYIARHRLADVALGYRPAVAIASASPYDVSARVLPRLVVVPGPKPTDLAIDAMHTLTLPTDRWSVLSPSGSADEQVYAVVDAEREELAVIDLTTSADYRPYGARHTA